MLREQRVPKAQPFFPFKELVHVLPSFLLLAALSRNIISHAMSKRLQELVVRPPERRLVDVLKIPVDGEAQRIGNEDLLLLELGSVVMVRARALWG